MIDTFLVSALAEEHELFKILYKNIPVAMNDDDVLFVRERRSVVLVLPV